MSASVSVRKPFPPQELGMITPRRHHLCATECWTCVSNPNSPLEAEQANRRDPSWLGCASHRQCRSHPLQRPSPKPACCRSQLHRKVPGRCERVPSHPLKPIQVAWTAHQRRKKKPITPTLK